MTPEPEIDRICIDGHIPVEQRRDDQTSPIIDRLAKPV
jgi:hypothetical protein